MGSVRGGRRDFIYANSFFELYKPNGAHQKLLALLSWNHELEQINRVLLQPHWRRERDPSD